MKDTQKDYTTEKHKRFSLQTKLFYVKKILNNEMGVYEVVRKLYGVADMKSIRRKANSINRWMNRYVAEGENGLNRRESSAKGKKKTISDKRKLFKMARRFNIELEKDTDFISLFIKTNSENKRKVIDIIFLKYKRTISKTKILKYFNFSRSTYYRKPINTKYENDNKNKELIKNIFYKYKETFGRKRISIYLEKEYGVILSEMQVYRLMKQLKIKSKIR